MSSSSAAPSGDPPILFVVHTPKGFAKTKTGSERRLLNRHAQQKAVREKRDAAKQKLQWKKPVVVLDQGHLRLSSQSPREPDDSGPNESGSGPVQTQPSPPIVKTEPGFGLPFSDEGSRQLVLGRVSLPLKTAARAHLSTQGVTLDDAAAADALISLSGLKPDAVVDGSPRHRFSPATLLDTSRFDPFATSSVEVTPEIIKALRYRTYAVLVVISEQ